MSTMPSRTKQVSVFVENKPGRLTDILRAVESRGISIKGMSVSDAADIGIVRLIVSDPESVVEELRRRGMTGRIDTVLCVQIDDVPGGLLHGVAEPISGANVNLEYLYAYTEPSSGKIMAVVKTDNLEVAERSLAGQA